MQRSRFSAEQIIGLLEKADRVFCGGWCTDGATMGPHYVNGEAV